VEDRRRGVIMPGGRDFHRGDIWADEDDDNPRTFDISLEEG